MAVGYILARNNCSWLEVHNPAFVFTSPNMNQGITAGTRSHIVPEECPLALWLEDSTTNKMYRIMIDPVTVEYCNSGSYGYFKVIDYVDFKITKFTVTMDIPTVEYIIYVFEQPTFELPTKYIVDEFSSTTVDTSKWIIYDSVNSTVSINDNKLELSYPVITSLEYCRCKSTLSYTFDFTTEVNISIDFSNILDASSGARVGILFVGTSDECYIEMRRDDVRIVSTFDGTSTFTKFFDNILVRIIKVNVKLYIYIAQNNSAFRLYKILQNVPQTDVEIELGLAVYSSSAPVFARFDNFISTDKLTTLLPTQAYYDNRFYVTNYSPVITNWYKFNTVSSDIEDSIGDVDLTSSGINFIYRSDIDDTVAEFNGAGVAEAAIYIDLDTKFSVSLFAASYGHTCSGESEFFGECQTIVNLVGDDNTYFSIGLTDTNTLYYKINSDVTTFRSDTGITLSSGTLDHITMSVDGESGVNFYYNSSLVSNISGNIGTISSGILSIGNITKGVGSKFYGQVSDVRLISSGILSEYDVDRLYNNILQPFGPAIYGTTIGSISVQSDEFVFLDYPMFKSDLYLSSALHIIIKFGEAYNCYITAWDDTTHTTTSNVVFTQQLLKLSAAVFRCTQSTSGYPKYSAHDLDHSYIISSAVSDMPIKGDTYFFGKFNLVYYTGYSSHVGDTISLRPRISSVTKNDFPPGNYDFVITFHYQYT